jgi:tetratricopeptide (TPR) repeat protein
MSYPILMVLANHPRLLLGIERTQPGSLIRSGRGMLEAGNMQKAVEAFRRAQEKYEALYSESGLERHQQYAAEAAVSVADSYRILGVTPEWHKAELIYKDVLKDYPGGNHGNWTLSLGMALEQLQNYDEAIKQFDHAIEVGSGMTQLYTRYERGRSYLEKGDLDHACDDLYWFIRSQKWELSEEQWMEFLRLEGAANPKKYFILGFTYRALNETEKAIDRIQTYLGLFPNDRAALYLKSSLLDEAFVQDPSTIALTEMMPPQEKNPYELSGGLLNLYIADEGEYTLNLLMSSPQKQPSAIEENKFEVPVITVLCNGEEIKSFFVSLENPTEYAIHLTLMEGKNIILIQTQGFVIDKPLITVDVHSIQLSKSEM